MSPPNPFDAAARALLEGAKLSTRPVSWTERQLRRTLGSKPESAGRDTAPSRAPGGATGAARDDAKLAERMNRLLKRGLEQTAAASSQDLYIALVEQLVPDEARILSALSDGSAATIIHVYERTRPGAGGQPVLENASLVGRTANLTLPHHTPAYIGHLLTLGLIEIGPENPELKTEYEILAADDAVRAAIKRASRGPIPPRTAKQTVRLSRLGQEFWAACVQANQGPDTAP